MFVGSMVFVISSPAIAAQQLFSSSDELDAFFRGSSLLFFVQCACVFLWSLTDYSKLQDDVTRGRVVLSASIMGCGFLCVLAVHGVFG
jgi:hypothetical protein